MFCSRLIFQKSKKAFSPRFYCEGFNKPAGRNTSIQKSQQIDESVFAGNYNPESFGPIKIKYWNERAALKKERRMNTFPYSAESIIDVLKFFQSFRNFPTSFEEFLYLLKKRYIRRQLIEQKYLPQRVNILKPDLAAAHFIVGRGGSVKFVGNPEWVGTREKTRTLPITFIPGMFIEGIKAENTSLYCEGLSNLEELHHLSYVSLKNLDTVDDWFLDILTQKHHENLKHLDISGCKNVTYRGLSCFYRFERLEVLEVGGIPDTTEFKLACLMLYEFMPFLDIKGIDLSLPPEIKPPHVEDKEKPPIEK